MVLTWQKHLWGHEIWEEPQKVSLGFAHMEVSDNLVEGSFSAEFAGRQDGLGQ